MRIPEYSIVWMGNIYTGHEAKDQVEFVETDWSRLTNEQDKSIYSSFDSS